jgi:dihydrofolate reductase (trimethoprim resistance protein)
MIDLSTFQYPLGAYVTKRSGSHWTGRVVGFYSTSLTPIGYCVESDAHPGSVQIYPEHALRWPYGEASHD